MKHVETIFVADCTKGSILTASNVSSQVGPG
jgi:hypothetical protein